MNFKILLLKVQMLLDFLISGPRLLSSFKAEGKREFLKKRCFARSWGVFSEFRFSGSSSYCGRNCKHSIVLT